MVSFSEPTQTTQSTLHRKPSFLAKSFRSCMQLRFLNVKPLADSKNTWKTAAWSKRSPYPNKIKFAEEELGQDGTNAIMEQLDGDVIDERDAYSGLSPTEDGTNTVNIHLEPASLLPSASYKSVAGNIKRSHTVINFPLRRQRAISFSSSIDRPLTRKCSSLSLSFDDKPRNLYRDGVVLHADGVTYVEWNLKGLKSTSKSSSASKYSNSDHDPDNTDCRHRCQITGAALCTEIILKGECSSARYMHNLSDIQQKSSVWWDTSSLSSYSNASSTSLPYRAPHTVSNKQAAVISRVEKGEMSSARKVMYPGPAILV